MKNTFLAVSATALASVLALAGCASGTGTSGSTTPATSSASSMPGMNQGPGMMSSSAPTASAEHNAADTMFVQGMIPHHTQAVEMSDMMLAKKDIPAPITALATKIKAAQGPEITTMTGWLKDWNEAPTMSPGHGMGEGMMGDNDLKKLETAQGTEASKLFLTQMIAHHQGAIMMAKTETTQGKNPDALRLSKDIATSQESEIQEMQQLLATL
ncbi:MULTISPECIES: DUF305 domain-containing protein [unclassified Arthrobacter]|uniref:DUF305 domain-containing protein n=1 Tax=unclassified Arthrobacter TaxID=235627 RepID=UPI002DFADAAA|nr:MULTISPECIES: DUF305 domain-containing protein [unclassified Arthrobacter]MEC5191679.1 uncharacterized protein (DUF305 family) [Arthrobacter sp. MP_M4]MEC5203369.1 uncharacterized protein (DUF305 family) [Arthrobacter sp. MP_M7]